MVRIIRLGDTSDHGGAVVTSSSDFEVEGIMVARVTDKFSCPIHGINAIIEGSPQHENNDLRVARHGDHTECGAALIASAHDYDID